MSKPHLTAKQAASLLGVTLPTLYAYTSRGLLRSEPVPGRPRERRYYREDVDRLRERKEIRRDPAKAAARGLHWGNPVLSSAITLIQDGKLYYRGHDALQLAERARLEDIAELLWAVEGAEGKRLFEQPGPIPLPRMALLRGGAKHPLVWLQAALPLAGARDPAAYDLRPGAVRQTGARILALCKRVVGGRDSREPVHVALQTAWAPGDRAAGEVIRYAVVLCADHELNVSAFTARCAASAGASLYDTVSAALATLKGSRHGGETVRVSSLLAEARRTRSARAAVANWLQRGERVPGFGHPLYSGGDPRAEVLLRLADRGGDNSERRLVRAVRKAGSEVLQELPNLDFGLVAVARTYRLPEFAPLVLFALGRMVGWIAHAMEQYATGDLIRPRARYVGPLPGGDGQS